MYLALHRSSQTCHHDCNRLFRSEASLVSCSEASVLTLWTGNITVCRHLASECRLRSRAVHLTGPSSAGGQGDSRHPDRRTKQSEAMKVDLMLTELRTGLTHPSQRSRKMTRTHTCQHLRSPGQPSTNHQQAGRARPVSDHRCCQEALAVCWFSTRVRGRRLSSKRRICIPNLSGFKCTTAS